MKGHTSSTPPPRVQSTAPGNDRCKIPVGPLAPPRGPITARSRPKRGWNWKNNPFQANHAPGSREPVAGMKKRKRNHLNPSALKKRLKKMAKTFGKGKRIPLSLHPLNRNGGHARREEKNG